MKQSRFTTLLAAGAVSAIALTTSFAHESTATPAATTTEGAAATASTSTSPIEASGVISAYTLGGDFIMVKTETSTAPIMYYHAKSTAIIDAEGKAGKWSMLKSGMPIKYTYTNDGDRMVITKIMLEKPKSSSDKTATKP